MNARKRAVFRADVAARQALVLYRRGESRARVLRTDSAPLPLSPSQKAKLEKLGRDYLAELRKRGDAGWADVERDEHGRWTPSGAAQVKAKVAELEGRQLSVGQKAHLTKMKNALATHEAGRASPSAKPAAPVPPAAAAKAPGPLKLEQLPFGQGDLAKLGAEDPKSYESSIKPAMTKWEAGVTGHERKAIDDYRGPGYEKTNRSLRQGGEPGYYARLLTESIDKAEPLQRDVVVWRGMEHAELGKDPVAFLAQHGNVLTDKAFVSTSIVPSVAHGFASGGLLKAGPEGVVFRITVPKGTRTPYLGSEDSDEGEHILQRVASLKVTRAMRTNDGLTVLDAHYLGSKPGSSSHADRADLEGAQGTLAPRFIWQEGDVEWSEEGERTDAGWEDVPRGKGGQWTAGHALPAGMNAAHKAHHSKLVGAGKHEEATAYRAKFGGAPASTPAAQPGSLAALSSAPVPKPSQLTFEKSGKGMGGAGEKDVYQDATGQEWLFKAATVKGTNEPKPYAVHAQVAFAEIAHEIKDHVPVAAATINGKLGTLQPILSLASPSNLAQVEPSKLTEREKLDVAQEHVLDWLMSQHDTHGGNLLRTSDGRVVGIDKEQGYRYFGKDKLDVHYQPNTETYGEKPPYYNSFWKGVGDGSVKFDPHALAPTIAKVEAIPSARFASIIRPYAESAGRGEAFVKAAVARKESIRGDFERLIGGVQGKPFSFAHQDAQRSDWNEEEFLRIPAGKPGGGQFSGAGERHVEQNPLPSLSAGVKAGLTKKENKAAAAMALAGEKAKQEPPSDLQAAPFEPLKPEETGELRQPYQPPQIHLLHEQTSTAQAPSGATKPSLDPDTGKPWVITSPQPPPPPTPAMPAPTAHEPEAQSTPAHVTTSANPTGMKAAHKAHYTKFVKSGQHEKAAAYIAKHGAEPHTPSAQAPQQPKGPALQIEQLSVTRADLYAHLGGVDAVTHHAAESAAAVTWRDKLTHVFRVALGLYQGTGYRLWNKALRKKSLTDIDHAEKIRHLQAALDTAPALEKDVTVWRGFEAEGGISKLATDPAAFLAKVGNVFHDNAFVSTSIHLGKAIIFAGHTKSSAVVMRIRVPAGTKTPYLTHAHGGAYEYEHLLQRDSDFKIDRIYKTSDGYTVLDGHYLGSTPVGLSQRGHHKDAKDDPSGLTDHEAKYIWHDGDITFRHEE